jgi:hypothetical protein
MNRKYIENSRDPLRQVISRNTEFLTEYFFEQNQSI